MLEKVKTEPKKCERTRCFERCAQSSSVAAENVHVAPVEKEMEDLEEVLGAAGRRRLPAANASALNLNATGCRRRYKKLFQKNIAAHPIGTQRQSR